ncbi:MAG: hypothetical protein KDD61_07140 [Bdellovibrionales bacterium]|nr:hypothetical protein [Bdellovibrionales bacterium]
MSTSRKIQNQQGQIVVEYVLLLVISVGIAILITTSMVNRNPESPGFLMVKWREIIQAIGSDPAESPTSE